MYFKKANIFKQIFFSKGTIVVIFFIIAFVGFGLYSIVGKSIDASNSRKVAESEIEDLKIKEAQLTKKIELLKTPEGQAEALKEQYPVVASGEKVVVITEEVSSGDSKIEQVQAPQKKSFWTYLKNLFK